MWGRSSWSAVSPGRLSANVIGPWLALATGAATQLTFRLGQSTPPHAPPGGPALGLGPSSPVTGHPRAGLVTGGHLCWTHRVCARAYVQPSGCPAGGQGWDAGPLHGHGMASRGMADPSSSARGVWRHPGDPHAQRAQAGPRPGGAGRAVLWTRARGARDVWTHGLAFASSRPGPAFGSFHARASWGAAVAWVALWGGDSSAGWEGLGHMSRLDLTWAGGTGCDLGSGGSVTRPQDRGAGRLLRRGALDGACSPSCPPPFCWSSGHCGVWLGQESRDSQGYLPCSPCPRCLLGALCVPGGQGPPGRVWRNQPHVPWM